MGTCYVSWSARSLRRRASPYVRSLLHQAVVRRDMAEAADRYAAFLRETPDERAWLDEWTNADLARPAKRRRR